MKKMVINATTGEARHVELSPEEEEEVLSRREQARIDREARQAQQALKEKEDAQFFKEKAQALGLEENELKRLLSIKHN